MKKNDLILLLFFLLLHCLSYSQADLKFLEGEWLVYKVINVNDSTITRGKYAEIDGYIKFNFNKINRLIITTSPFDMGMEQSYSIKDMEINMLIPDFLPTNIPETKYKINLLNKTKLILQTTNPDNIQIEYFLKRQIVDEKQPGTIEYEPIIIKRIILEDKRDNFVYFYNFKQNRHQYLHPVYNKDYTLGTDLSAAVKYPDDFEKEKLSEELTLKIFINTKGKVKKLEKMQGINPIIDKSVVKFMNKTRWKPIKINDELKESELIFHFIFLLNDGKLIKSNY